MIKIFLLMGLLSHTIIRPQQSMNPPAGQPPQKEMISRWTAQVTNNLAHLTQEAQKTSPKASEIIKLYEEINKTLYRIATLNSDAYQKLSKKRDSVIEQATQSIKKKMIQILQSAHEDAKKISYKDFFIGSKINQFMEAAKAIFLKIDAALVMAKIVFIKKDIGRDKEARESINRLFGKIANQMHILFSLIVNRIPQQTTISGAQFNFDTLLTYWKNYLQAINKSSLVHPELSIPTYEKERAMIDKTKAEIENIIFQARTVHYDLNQMKENSFLTASNLKSLMLAYDKYSTHLNQISHHLNIHAQFEKERAEIEQEINKVLIRTLQVQMKKIQKTLETLRSLTLEGLEGEMKTNKEKNDWEQLNQEIVALTKIYYTGGDHLKIFPPPEVWVKELKKSFHALEALFADVLFTIKKDLMAEKCYLEYSLTQTIPTLYGRVLGQYETVMRIFTQLDPSLENKFSTFKRKHAKIIEKSDKREQQAVK